jgi:hypothetical protein
MATAVSICSNAMLKLGAQPINSFDEDLPRAQLASNLYESVRDDMLRAHPWNCAVRRILLAPNAVAPAFGYQYQFNLPGDWLRTIQVTSNDCTVDHQVEGQMILSDSSSIELRYIFRNDVEATWDSSLVAVMTMAMTAEMAYALTSSTSEAQARAQALDYALRKARAVDGQENPAETLGDFPLLGSRYSGGFVR